MVSSAPSPIIRPRTVFVKPSAVTRALNPVTNDSGCFAYACPRSSPRNRTIDFSRGAQLCSVSLPCGSGEALATSCRAYLEIRDHTSELALKISTTSNLSSARPSLPVTKPKLTSTTSISSVAGVTTPDRLPPFEAISSPGNGISAAMATAACVGAESKILASIPSAIVLRTPLACSSFLTSCFAAAGVPGGNKSATTVFHQSHPHRFTQYSPL